MKTDSTTPPQYSTPEGLIAALYEHLDYCGWGDSWEREPAIAKGGLRDQTEAYLKSRGML